MSEQNALAEKLGIEAEGLAADKAVFTMPVEGNTQVQGILHGGATAALCENCASAAANVHAQTMGHVAVGTEITVSHLRPGRTGKVVATAVAEHLGRTRTVHRVSVTDEDGRLLATALVANALIHPLPRPNS